MNGPEPTAKQAALGRRLFFDRRLSLNRTISCAMCHIPAQGFAANELATAVGIEGRTVKRNAPTLLNVGFLTNLFHDARENRLEQQVWSPLLAHNEMANKMSPSRASQPPQWAQRHRPIVPRYLQLAVKRDPPCDQTTNRFITGNYGGAFSTKAMEP